MIGKVAKFFLFLLLASLLGATSLRAQSPPPRIFFTDLLSGPNAGGQNNKGAFVTLYGKRFGATRGTSTVTVGGGAVDNCPLWTDTKVVCQLGPQAQTGNIVLTVNGQTSNGMAFTVRPGNIYFTALTGNDNNDGSFANPFGTVKAGKDALAPGDILYVMDGVVQDTVDDFDTALIIAKACEQDRPCALVVYPGAKVTIGQTTGSSPSIGIRNPDVLTNYAHWVIAGFTVRATQDGDAIDINNSDDYRIIGNDVSVPFGIHSAALQASNSNFVKMFGNYGHDQGSPNSPATKFQHMFYYTTDSNHAEFAWNEVDARNGNTCRGLQFHSSPAATAGNNQYDLSVHDNYIHDTRCDGINFATIDPSKGKVEAYNNVIVHVGFGVLTGAASNYSCIYFAGITNAGQPGSGTAHVYNNTLVDCGAEGGPDSGAIGYDDPAAPIKVLFENNIVSQLAGEFYFNPNSHTVASNFTGSKNLFFGLGAGPSFLSSNINADPKFANAAAWNFRLISGSPAIDAGNNTGIGTDFDGVARPQGAAFDVGALEFFTGSSSQPPNPPKNLRVTTVK